VYDIVVPYQYAPAPPTEGPAAVSFPEFPVGEPPDLIDIDAVQQIRSELPDRRHLHIPVVRADFLAHVAAPDKAGFFQYFDIFGGEIPFLLRYI
jgi:hypothetical protein